MRLVQTCRTRYTMMMDKLMLGYKVDRQLQDLGQLPPRDRLDYSHQLRLGDLVALTKERPAGLKISSLVKRLKNSSPEGRANFWGGL